MSGAQRSAVAAAVKMKDGRYNANINIFHRFSKENFPNILKIVKGLEEIGKGHNATAAQVTLAWLLAQDPIVIPIPGTKQIKVRMFPGLVYCSILTIILFTFSI